MKSLRFIRSVECLVCTEEDIKSKYIITDLTIVNWLIVFLLNTYRKVASTNARY